MKRKIVFILGPTSSGKTLAALSFAERNGGEIVSCDSMQVYRDMDIITQAPGDDVLSRVPHYLVKMLSPEEEFSAARFVEEAGKSIRLILEKGKIPVFAGGTGLYVKALVDGLFTSPPKDDDFRARMNRAALEQGPEYLYSRLLKVDPDTASRLHPNDIRRVVRALEVYELTGRAIRDKKNEACGIAGIYDLRMFGLSMPRGLLYSRIEDNVESMFSRGLVDEVERILKRSLSLTAEKALGIKEVSLFLDGKLTLEEAKAELKKNTRRYAKRQLTWFRADSRVKWLDARKDPGDIAGEISDMIK
ncbi:MAG: tRNA (adenosine(37)-N6)-dimethylallyltransferase MiaA [Candidatus Omnitrophota bacterium]